MMRPPLHVTFTGLDARTDISRCEQLSLKYPIEWGILFANPKPSSPRYPFCYATEDEDNYDNVVYKACKSALRLSAHFCKDYAKAANEGVLKYKHTSTLALFKCFDRIQINLKQDDFYKLGSSVKFNLRLFQSEMNVPVILQSRNQNVFPSLPLYATFNQFHFLYDPSGGRGISLLDKTVPVPLDKSQFVGYAGGINPENVLKVIESITTPYYWIDMESGVRTDDWLDLDKCEAVCKAIWG